LTQAQVQQLAAVRAADPLNPGAIRAALSIFGDQYAAAALQGITNPQPLNGQVIANPNAVYLVSAQGRAPE